MTNDLRIVRATPRAVVGTFRDVVITVWRADIELEDMRASAVAQEKASQGGGPFASISVVERATTRITDTARLEAARITEQGGTRLLGVAVVLPGTGFWSAVARTVATGIHFASRSRAPQQVFADPGGAADWVCERLGHGHPTAVALAAAVAAARLEVSPSG